MTSKPLAAEKPAKTTAEKPAEKPAAPTAAKPVEKSATKPEEKPAEPPVDKSPPKPAETKPSKPAESKPADAKPAESKPKQSRLDLPPLSLVAMAGREAVLLAQAELPAVKADAKPEVKADVKPQAKPDAKADAKPEAKADTKAEAKPEAKAETKVSSGEAAGSCHQGRFRSGRFNLAASVPGDADALVDRGKTGERPGRNMVTQQVAQSVRYDEDRLRKLVEQALEENKIPAKLVVIQLNAVAGVKKSDRWELKLAPSTEVKIPLTAEKFKKVLKTLESDMAQLPFFPIEDNIGSAVANDTRSGPSWPW